MGTISVVNITAVVAVMGTKHCVQGGNRDDFLSPCSSLIYPSWAFSVGEIPWASEG